VVALMGMNDGARPHRSPPGSTWRRQPRLSDAPRRRSSTVPQALMCARDQLIVTWTGRDARTDVTCLRRWW
jgi:exonuclease V gamma subunit